MSNEFNEQFCKCYNDGMVNATAIASRTAYNINKFDFTCFKHGGKCSEETCKEIGDKNE